MVYAQSFGKQRWIGYRGELRGSPASLGETARSLNPAGLQANPSVTS